MYKIPTILGIALIFGFFFWDSIANDTSDPTKIVLSDKDTLGRNWDAMAEQKALQLKQQTEMNAVDAVQAEKNEITPMSLRPLLNPSEDPLRTDKSSEYNYTSVPAGDGREIITGIDNSDDNEDKYMSRHDRERSLKNREEQLEASENR
ncbi:MAG: hypothetical protein U0U67_07730 [Chitinophagales bacterium]